MSVSESHNINNVRRTRAESVSEAKKIWEMRKTYPEMTVKISLATVFGCPFEGKIKPEATLSFVREYYQLGFRDMSLADTVGYGNPREIQEICGLCITEFPDVTFGIHLHNTRGFGPGQFLCRLRGGGPHYRRRDRRAGRVSLCSRGFRNTSTEDLVFMFEEMGVKTGIDMKPLLEVADTFKARRETSVTAAAFSAREFLSRGDRSLKSENRSEIRRS